MNSKKAKVFARKHSVVRVITDTQNDYRWWRYQDSEPECGYVVNTTTYSVPAYPCTQKSRTRKEPRIRLSRRQLRKRIYGAGYRGDRIKEVFAEIVGFQTQNLEMASQGLRYPFGWNMTSIREKLGNRGWKVLAKGIRPLMIVLDELAYFSSPGIANFAANAASISRGSLEVTQELHLAVA